MSALFTLASEYALPSSPRPLTYGTAGFRMSSATPALKCISFRVGLLAALRSAKLGAATGLMITASHNPPVDNGVKCVEPEGEMLPLEWESVAFQIVNCKEDALEDVLKKIRDKYHITLPSLLTSKVIIARDTRPSGEGYAAAATAAVKFLGGEVIDFGVQTTPVLHYLVRSLNKEGGTSASYGVPTIDGYMQMLSKAFGDLSSGGKSPSDLIVDCANGVGALSLRLIAPLLAPAGLNINAVNTATDNPEKLNVACGADFVKSTQSIPPSIPKLEVGQRACSLDGDADRIVYYYRPSEQELFRLLDGDKISALASVFFQQLVANAGLTDEVKIGVVQTAYANGNSTKFISSRLPVRCVPTGVKHLHHAACAFDIGIYFEANGHGTVLFSDAFNSILDKTKPETPSQQTALTHLRALTKLINQAVGDALSDLLLVEVILRHKAWQASDWDSFYTDFPNKLLKVSVKDRSAFMAVDAERRLESPAGLQEQIDNIVAQYTEGRSFVRPSGTEDCVRVYAEARHARDAEELAFKIAGLVYDSAGGDPSKRPAEFL